MPAIKHRQDLRQHGHGRLNIDQYQITIDGDGQSAEQFFAHLRKNLNEIIFKGTDYSLKPYDSVNSRRWASAKPLGAVMVFTLAAVTDDLPLERGAVFVSCSTGSDMVFSTLEMIPYGVHPVAGNRAFGVVKNSD
ncbi:MAG: hypothetical protein PsegKO_33100 [Pseudohongiellaceae bacterium]